MIQMCYFIISLLLINSIQCNHCDLSDESCLTERANRTHHIFVNGVDGIVPPTDPILRDLIEGNLPTINYKLKNFSLSGVKNCNVEKLKIEVKDLFFKYHLECPFMIVHADYEMKGKLASFDIDGKGKATVLLEEYVIILSGSYQNSTKHISLISDEIDANVNGRVTFDFNNLFDGDEEKSKAVNKFMNDNWHTVDEALRTPPLKSAMAVYMENLNTYMKVVPREQL